MSISAGELFGLATLVGVATGVATGLVMPIVIDALRRRVDYHDRRVAVLHRWLAARLTLSQCSREFVEAFRDVNARADATPAREVLQRAEQARASWLSALRSWQEATADFLLWRDDAPVGTILRRFEQPDALAIRAVIARNQTEVTRLFAELDDLDRLAIATVQQLFRVEPPWWWVRLARAVRFMRRIAYRWSRP